MTLSAGTLNGGGTITGRLVAGCTVTIAKGSFSVLRIEGALVCSDSFNITMGVQLVDADQALSKHDRLTVTGAATFAGTITTSWAWQGSNNSAQLSPSLSFPIVTYGSGAGVMNYTNFSVLGVHEGAVQRREISSMHIVDFVGCQSGTSGTYQCTACPEGTFSLRGGDAFPLTCVGCSTGSYQNASGASTCKACGPGTFTSTIGGSACLACPQGMYQSGFGETFCEPCGNGTFGPAPGLRECLPCQAGSYAENVSSIDCAFCPSGEMTFFPCRLLSVHLALVVR